MDESQTPTKTKFDLSHAESRVAFAVSACSTAKQYSFYSLNRIQAKHLLRRLKHFEQYKWKDFVDLPRKNGLTPEIVGSKSYNLIDEQNTLTEQFTERYYFHFRVPTDTPFRVFGYQQERLFCITHIDPKGKIHEH